MRAMWRVRRLFLPLTVPWLLLALLLTGLARASGAPIRISLGTVGRVTVWLDNRGQPAQVVRLYEAQMPLTLPLDPLSVPLPKETISPSPALLDKLERASDGRAEMVIYLRDQADLRAAASTPEWEERGWAVYETLTHHAAQSQASLRVALEARGYRPDSLWIVNALALRGDRALAYWLAEQPEVALVTLNQQHALTYDPDFSHARVPLTDTIAWGVQRLGASEVWERWGVRGEGIVVANIDSGVGYTNSALLPAYRGWSAGGVSHDYHWFDPLRLSPIPEDWLGHGTHTMGTMVGGQTEGVQVGVAPGARWIAARACLDLFCDDIALIKSAQWMLAPTDLAGRNPRPDLRPHIINNSWGALEEDLWYLGYVQAWYAAGIFSVFANGNYGPPCHSSVTPGNYPLSFSVGALTRSGEIAEFSSRGPAWQGTVKPDLSAPGAQVPSSGPGKYPLLTLSGTSMAAPHVAGAVALLWSANPALRGDIALTRQLLIESARPRPTGEACGRAAGAVPNTIYGWGEVSAWSLVQAGRVDVPWLSLPEEVTLPLNSWGQVEVTLDARRVAWPGLYQARILLQRGKSFEAIPIQIEVTAQERTALLTGRLLDRWQGVGLQGDLLIGEGPRLPTDAQGHFSATLPYGTYLLRASAPGYLPMSNEIPLFVPHHQPFTMTPDLPHLMVEPLPDPFVSAHLAFGEHLTRSLHLHNGGPRPLQLSASVPALEWSIEEGEPQALYDMGRFVPLPLADETVLTEPLKLGFFFPLYGVLTDTLYLSSNGWVSAIKPESTEAWALCLPGAYLPPQTLAPFWSDLDPSQGGAVRAGAVAPDRYVISFEGVPHWQPEGREEPAPTYTFQLVLHADGAAEFLYGEMGEMPTYWSVGVSTAFARGQGIACHKAPISLVGRRWLLRNQPSPAQWLYAEPESLTIAPGEAASMTVGLAGNSPAPWRGVPYRAHLQLETNDPALPTLQLPVRLAVEPPPRQLTLPLAAQP